MTDLQITSYSPKYQLKVKEFILGVLKEFGFDYKPEWDYDLEDPSKYYEAFFILTDGENVYGTVALKRHDNDIAEIKRLYLDASLRGKGYGSKLFDEILSFTKEHGFKKAILDTWVSFESAIKLYKSRGFTQTKKVGQQIYMEKELLY